MACANFLVSPLSVSSLTKFDSHSGRHNSAVELFLQTYGYLALFIGTFLEGEAILGSQG